MDRNWWNEYSAELRALRGVELWTSNREAARVYRLNFVSAEIGAGMPRAAANSIKLGGHSGYQALQLAILFGAARVVLLGFDMRNDGARSHWHGNHKNLGNPMQNRFANWIRQFHKLNAEKPADLEIVNCTRQTALTCFPRHPLEQVIA